MINFDENKMIDNGLFIYEARNQLEAIANNICQQGLSNIFFSSVGGSQAMMKRIYYTYPVLLVWLVSTLLPQFCIAMPNEQKENNDVVIENAEMRLIISNDGKARSLIHKA